VVNVIYNKLGGDNLSKYQLYDFIEFKMEDGIIYHGNITHIKEKNGKFFYDVKSVFDNLNGIIEDVWEENIIRKYIETVLCYLERDNKCLMLLRNKRQNDINLGKWIGDGGHVEYNEEADDAMVREVLEETGVTILDYDKRGIVYFIDNDYTMVMHVYTSNSFSGFIHPCDEGTLSWISKDKIFDLNLWEGDKVFLKELMNNNPYFEIELNYDNNEYKGSKKL
jgi:8-oxo-dGTP pyrophosphatase MutT (NUDIX family)